MECVMKKRISFSKLISAIIFLSGLILLIGWGLNGQTQYLASFLMLFGIGVHYLTVKPINKMVPKPIDHRLGTVFDVANMSLGLLLNAMQSEDHIKEQLKQMA